MGILICLKITIASSSINVGFFDYGTINENEIIPVSNQATELPNLIHVLLSYNWKQTKILSLVQGQMAM
ncbi:MAG: hypothetical protein MRZ63_03240 [Anaerostipes sp.]|nr:hypothetical protein [Anaerostipes sp.]